MSWIETRSSATARLHFTNSLERRAHELLAAVVGGRVIAAHDSVDAGRMIAERGPILAAWARARICEALGGESATRPTPAWRDEQGATFVTLRRPNGELQGCVGSIRPARSLIDDVGRNALAAFDDSRGIDLPLAEIERLDVEISILSPLEAIARGTEAEMLSAIAVGDGVVFEAKHKRGVFLPVVWEKIPDHAAFFAALKRKAGLPPGFWSADVELWKYAVAHYTEKGSECVTEKHR